MDLYELRSEEMFIKSLRMGSEICDLMGDNFIGFKFVGNQEHAKYWNTILMNTCPEDLVVDYALLDANEIVYLPFSGKIWAEHS